MNVQSAYMEGLLQSLASMGPHPIRKRGRNRNTPLTSGRCIVKVGKEEGFGILHTVVGVASYCPSFPRDLLTLGIVVGLNMSPVQNFFIVRLTKEL